MTGHGVSYGAISVMNAIPCGIGSTIGIDLRTEAEYEPAEGISVTLTDRPGMSTMLAETCVRRTLEAIGKEEPGYRLKIDSQIPPSRGLKSSSSVCNAVISAVLDNYGVEWDPMDVIRLGVECAKECKVTITGAFDDACGCHLGGLVVTDNTKNELILRKEIPKYDVVIVVPDSDLPKSKVPVEKYKVMENAYKWMVPMIEDAYFDVMNQNGTAIADIMQLSTEVQERAMRFGALAAGVTGTGPAIAVVVDQGAGQTLQRLLRFKTILTETR